MGNRDFVRALIICVVLVLTAHSAGSRAQTEEDVRISEVEVSADGLHRVDPSLIAGTWLRPDADLSLYTRAFVMPTIVLFRETSAPSHSAWADSSRSEFPVSELMQSRLRETFGQSFHDAMPVQRAYDVADELGRDVVLVQAYMTDVTTGLPPDLAGANVISIRWIWDATLVVELRDSMSNEILARLQNRVRVDGPVDADRVWSLAPQITRMWSREMVGHLDELSDLYPSRLYRLHENATEQSGQRTVD